MKIYIPSRGRADRLPSLRFIPKERVTFVVSEAEGDAYRRVVPNVVCVPPSVQGLSPKRNWINAQHPVGETLLMIDDDLRFFARERLGVSEANRTLRVATPQDIDAMLRQIEESLETHAHVAISARQFNNTQPDAPRPYGRYLRVFGYNPKLIPSWPLASTLETAQDLDMAIQLYLMGLPAQIWALWAHDDALGTNGAGGCSVYRTKEMHARSVHTMAERYAPFVKVVEKDVKSGGEFGKRIDPKINWKLMFEDGCRRKEQAQ